ncbi:hypothetical protein VTO73DRAFT_2998 [Trametes versicolor]
MERQPWSRRVSQTNCKMYIEKEGTVAAHKRETWMAAHRLIVTHTRARSSERMKVGMGISPIRIDIRLGNSGSRRCRYAGVTREGNKKQRTRSASYITRRKNEMGIEAKSTSVDVDGGGRYPGGAQRDRKH